MPGFSITPVTDFPAASAEAFPDYIQFQAEGVDLGGPDADTVNFVGLTVTRGTGENASVVTVEADIPEPVASTFTWRDVPGDYTLVLADAQNGLSTSATTGSPTITIPADPDEGLGTPFASGDSVLIYQAGAAQVDVAAAAGVTLRYRSALTAKLAGQYAVATLIRRGANLWVLCGDLEVIL